MGSRHSCKLAGYTRVHLGGPDIREAKQVLYPGPPSSALGVPATTPRNDCTPSFTAQDVLDYENTQPFAVMRVEAVGEQAITKIWFITSVAASQQMSGESGESTGLADDALVCYVEFYGTFRTGSAPGGEPTGRTGTAVQVFDAHAGNLLVVGG
jgi:hypothetical protein